MNNEDTDTLLTTLKQFHSSEILLVRMPGSLSFMGRTRHVAKVGKIITQELDCPGSSPGLYVTLSKFPQLPASKFPHILSGKSNNDYLISCYED